jgi:outer membrane protein
MYKVLNTIALLLIISNFAIAQKLGHIDSDFVLNKMPEYTEKKAEIDQLAKDYEKEVRSLFNEVEKMRSNFRLEQVAFTSEMKKERQAEIDKKEQEALEKQSQFFAYDGLFFKKEKELLRPLQQKLWEAVEVVAKKRGLDYIFDKAADVGIIYSNPVHDYTEYVLEELGLLEQEKN